MKRLWIAVILLGLAVGLCVTANLYQHRCIDDMLAKLTHLEQVYDGGDRAAARALAEDMAEEYAEVGHVLFCFLPHGEMADSQETVAVLPQLVAEGGEEEMRMEMARLREQLTYLRGVDDLTWENVL